MTVEFGPPVDKYVSITRGGIVNLRTAENLSSLEFKGYPANRFGIYLEFSPEAVDILNQRVVNPLATAAQELGVNFIWAGRNFPFHSTILEGEYKGKNPQEQANIFRELKVNSQLEQVAQELGEIQTVGFQFVAGLDRAGAMVLGISPIPPLVEQAREDAGSVYQNAGLSPRSMDNIFHSTVGRITQLPQADTEEIRKRLEDFSEEIRLCRREVFQNPLVLPVGKVVCSPVTDFLQQFPQEFVNPS